MNNNFKQTVIACLFTAGVLGCKHTAPPIMADILITNGNVYIGDGSGENSLDIAICQQHICAVSPKNSQRIIAKRTIDAQHLVVSPGFIDPHTHSLSELLSDTQNVNLNYLTQGVTTVINGNDGAGPFQISETAKALEENGIGTNVALLAGHNTIRKHVMGLVNREATLDELKAMNALVDKAMSEGALGLSTGLYYVPGSYASTQEVLSLAKTTAKYHGIYDTHLRDESTFNIGLLAAIDEAIDIAQQSGVHLHLAHIKALGVDVWGQSEQVVDKISRAQANGFSITADQYPWLASGTMLHSAIIPKWLMADSKDAFHLRLKDPNLQSKIENEITENIRRRGGASALLITASSNEHIIGKTLKDIANEQNTTAAKAAIELVQQGDIRVASFNMAENDLKRFMVQPWVVTSSDGTDGHPRKYASFPKKFHDYVKQTPLLSIEEFIIKSASQTAELLNIGDRGLLKVGMVADVIIWDPNNYKPNANFSKWNQLSTGVHSVLVNGKLAIENGEYTGVLAGRFLKKSR
ncbi:N-acyl-D-amino-acid deacylase family protein [Thalassotalea fusca]